MTLREAVRRFPRPWIDGDVGFHEWILACTVLQAAIAMDEALSPSAREAQGVNADRLSPDGENKEPSK